jgi:hypothetical protein
MRDRPRSSLRRPAAEYLVAKPATHTRAESRGSRPSTAARVQTSIRLSAPLLPGHCQLSGHGMLVVSVARRLGSEGLLAYRAARAANVSCFIPPTHARQSTPAAHYITTTGQWLLQRLLSRGVFHNAENQMKRDASVYVANCRAMAKPCRWTGCLAGAQQSWEDGEIGRLSPLREPGVASEGRKIARHRSHGRWRRHSCSACQVRRSKD